MMKISDVFKLKNTLRNVLSAFFSPRAPSDGEIYGFRDNAPVIISGGGGGGGAWVGSAELNNSPATTTSTASVAIPADMEEAELVYFCDKSVAGILSFLHDQLGANTQLRFNATAVATSNSVIASSVPADYNANQSGGIVGTIKFTKVRYQGTSQFNWYYSATGARMNGAFSFAASGQIISDGNPITLTPRMSAGNGVIDCVLRWR